MRTYVPLAWSGLLRAPGKTATRVIVLASAVALLGAGGRMFGGVGPFGCEPVGVLHSPLSTHIRYRRVR